MMDNDIFSLTKIGYSGRDCMTGYKINFKKWCSVKEFLNEIKGQKYCKKFEVREGGFLGNVIAKRDYLQDISVDKSYMNKKILSGKMSQSFGDYSFSLKVK